MRERGRCRKFEAFHSGLQTMSNASDSSLQFYAFNLQEAYDALATVENESTPRRTLEKCIVANETRWEEMKESRTHRAIKA